MVNRVLKGFVVKNWGTPTPADFELIRKYISDDIKPEDLFVYPVKLCDNEVDRDGEFFSEEALNKLSDLFIGKPGIYDHDWNKAIQTHSRVYKTEVISEGDYKYLLAHAYTFDDTVIKGVKNGSLKEVSVGFEPGTKTEVDGAVRVDDVLDAYEFSFVSVPAQPKAGVLKNKSKGVINMPDNDFEVKIKGLNSTIDELKNTISSKDAEIASLKSCIKGMKMANGLETLFSNLVPKNSNAKELACNILEEKHFYDEDGNLNVDAAIALLKDEYDFLFDKQVAESNTKDVVDVPLDGVLEPKSNTSDESVVENKENINTDEDLKSFVAKELKNREKNKVVDKALNFTHTPNNTTVKGVVFRAGFHLK